MMDLVLLAVASPLALALIVFCAEMLAGLAGTGGSADDLEVVEPFAVIMPAHNEAKVIAATIRQTTAALRPADRLVVIADNCTDDTAEIARACGVEVVERFDPVRRGKGYALAHGVDSLSTNPPACVIVLDADCQPAPDALRRIAGAALASGRPVQACYLLEPAAGSGPVTRLSSFAFLIKNLVRQLGMSRLGRTCVLTGSGMAFPWKVIAQAHLADGEIVEDLVLGLRLTLVGHYPAFAATAMIRSAAAPTDADTGAQRKRWEHGFVSTATRFAPALLAAALRTHRREPAWLALHLIVLPVVSLFAACGAVIVLAGLAAGLGWGTLGLPLAMAGLLTVATTLVLVAWRRHGRQLLAPADIAFLPRYALSKLATWRDLVMARRAQWNRTER